MRWTGAEATGPSREKARVARARVKANMAARTGAMAGTGTEASARTEVGQPLPGHRGYQGWLSLLDPEAVKYGPEFVVAEGGGGVLEQQRDVPVHPHLPLV